MESNFKPVELCYCSECPLHCSKSNNTQYVPVELKYDTVDDNNNPIIDVLVIGDTIGYNEDTQGLPFSGDVGKEIKNAVKVAGIKNVAYTTLLKCRPFDASTGNNRQPTKDELSCCRKYLAENIKEFSPKIIVLLGKVAVQNLLPNPAWKDKEIVRISGESFKDENGVTWIALIHPSYYTKSKSYKEQQNFRNVFKKIPRILSGEQEKYAAKGDSILLTTVTEVQEYVEYLFSLDEATMEGLPGVAVDTETENLNRVAQNGLALIQFATDNSTGVVIPLEHPDSPFKGEELEEVFSLLRILFTAQDLKFSYWIAHHSKFDRGQLLRKLGIKKLAKPILDTEFLEYIIDENLRDSESGDFNRINLKILAKNRLSFTHYDSDTLLARSTEKGLWNLPLFNEDGSTSKLVDYSAMDVYVDRRLACLQVEELRSQKYRGSLRFATRWESSVSHLFVKMEANGFFVDKDQLEYLLSDSSPILSQIAKDIETIKNSPEGKKANSIILKTHPKFRGKKPLFGKDPWIFDITKKDHKVALLIDACGLEPVEIDNNGKPIVGKDGRISIGKKFFEKHKDNEISDLVKEYFGLEKLRTSYLNSVKEFFNAPDNKEDNRIHSTFQITSTVTGRASSKDPNLQQLPRADTPQKAMIKSMYGASPGHIILEADYGQAEVRWWAQIAGDEDFAKLFADMAAKKAEYAKNPTAALKKDIELTCDIHKAVAALMHQIKVELVTKPQRQGAKSLVFGAMFGQHFTTLAKLLKVTPEKAEELQELFLQQFKKAYGWLTAIEKLAERDRYVDSPYGRRRHLEAEFMINPNRAKRQARNTPIQGASSDTMFLCAARYQDWIEEASVDVKIVNAVHDAVVSEIPLDLGLIKLVMSNVERCMTDLDQFLYDEFKIKMIVPFEVEMKAGLRWGHCKVVDRHNVDEMFKVWVEQDKRLQNGEKWYQIVG